MGTESSLRITQSLGRNKDIRPPKSNAGRRSIALDANTIRHLKAWKLKQAEYLLSLGISQNNDTPVVNDQIGGYHNQNNFYHWWWKFREENSFDNLKFHELRHTQATLLIANGVDIKTVQAHLGHSNASLTINLYAHTLPEKDREAADKMGTILNKKAPSKAKVVNL